MICKVADTQDGRVVHCHLTKKGREVVSRTFAPKIGDARLEKAMMDGLQLWLRTQQQKYGRSSFGICRTCTHFDKRGSRPRCRFLDVALKRAEIDKLCREHQFPGQESHRAARRKGD